MTLTGSILQVPREKDKTYLYMPNPALVHGKSQKVNHHLKVVDVYIYFGCPEVFTIEPVFSHYRPDAFMIDGNGHNICIEVQLTPISKTKMQQKIDNFRATFHDHHCYNLYIITDHRYDGLKVPEGFHIHKLPIPKEVYSQT